MYNKFAFSDYCKDDIHGTIPYPAMMVAPMQKHILSSLMRNNRVTSVFDPFHGSATTLYEAFELNPNVFLIGCDINPLANLIAHAKLGGVSSEIFNSIHILKKHLNDVDIKPFSFTNEIKWFRVDILNSIKQIRHAIKKVPCRQDRIFLWCMLSDIIRKYSNTRTTTYKLHIKKESAIQKMRNNVVDDYITKVENSISYYLKSASHYTLFKHDILDLCRNIKDNFFDLTITSPPYGDNQTTVAYGQFSSLALQIIDKNDLTLDGWELSNYSIIDSRSMGGPLVERYKESEQRYMHYLDEITKPIAVHKQAKVRNFFIDYYTFLDNISRITRKYLIFTLGNRTVDGQKIALNEITINYLLKSNWTLCNTFERKIPRKRVPPIVSSVNNSPVPSMLSEYVLILKKL